MARSAVGAALRSGGVHTERLGARWRSDFH